MEMARRIIVALLAFLNPLDSKTLPKMVGTIVTCLVLALGAAQAIMTVIEYRDVYPLAEVPNVEDIIEPVQDAENGGVPDSVPDAGVVPGCAVGPDGGTAAPGTLGRVILHEAAPGAVVVGSIEGAT